MQNKLEKDVITSMLCDIYSKMLTVTQEKALRLYLDENLSLAEIAQICNITRQAVLKNINAAKAKLFDLEDKLHLFNKLQNLSQLKELVKLNENNQAIILIDKMLDE